MTIQALIKPKLNCNPFAFLLQPHPQSVHGLQTCPDDLGYEINEEELASELHAHTTGEPVDRAILEVDPDESESIYRWFLS
jgi:hypothetical protein